MVNRNALVIVAHPDDETVFTGGTILSRPTFQWKVLCATYQRDSIRAQEMLNAISQYMANGINIDVEFLGHEDRHKTLNGGIDKERLASQVERYLGWPDMVITHNEKGDYGNYAHIAVNAVAKSVFPDAWEILCDDPTRFPIVERNMIWEVKLAPTIRTLKREIFISCYPSQQVLWTKASYLVDWAFAIPQERFGSML